MSLCNKLIFLFLFFACKIKGNKVINTCGRNTYDEPTKAEDCVEPGEICCYVSIQDNNNQITKFCVASPSDIEKEDIDDKVKEYTGFTVLEVQCNESGYINNSITALIFLSIIFIINL